MYSTRFFFNSSRYTFLKAICSPRAFSLKASTVWIRLSNRRLEDAYLVFRCAYAPGGSSSSVPHRMTNLATCSAHATALIAALPTPISTPASLVVLETIMSPA